MRLLTLILCLGFAASAIADDTIVIVFDNSGSMNEYMRSAKRTRMAVAQDALVDVVSKVPSTTKIGILTFNGWIYEIGPVDAAKLNTAVRNVKAAGGTPLYHFIKTGGTQLLAERQKNLNVGFYKMIVVTDGQANDNDAPLNNDSRFPTGEFKPGVLKDIISRGIIVDTIALEMSSAHSLKTSINGLYMNGNDPATIEQSLKRAVAEVGFNGNDGLTNDAFKEIGELPEVFVRDSLKGLTEFRNQPIGELPPRENAPIPAPKPISVTQNNPSVTSGSAVLIGFVVVGIVVGGCVLLCKGC